MITNYAIIDHVGQVANISEIYAKAFSYAVGYDKVYTLKKACEMRNPNYSNMLEEKQKSMKYAMRLDNEKGLHPKKVYLICPFVDSKTEFVADMWRDRNIEVEFVTEEPEPTTGVDSISRERRCAMVWAAALGWEFSAPLFRDEHPESIDMYTARPKKTNEVNWKDYEVGPDRELDKEDEELIEFLKVMDNRFPIDYDAPRQTNEYVEEGSYGAKRFTKPESFINAFRAIASEDECKAFFEQYLGYRGYDRQADGTLKFDEKRGDQIAYCLEPDWELCPVCGRPHYISAEKCQWCDTEFEGIELETFYDDDTRHSRDELNFNSFDNYSSADMAIKEYPRRKALTDLFDKGYHFPDMDAYYI